MVWHKRLLPVEAPVTATRAPTVPQAKPKAQLDEQKTLHLRVLRVMQCCLVYVLDEGEDQSEQEQLVRRMLIKCGARAEQLESLQLAWPGPFLRPNDDKQSLRQTCAGLLEGLGCNQIVVMGQGLWPFFDAVARQEFICTDGPATLLRQPAKRQTTWQQLLPLRKALRPAAA